MTLWKFKFLLLNMDCGTQYSMHAVLACSRARKPLMCSHVMAWKPYRNATCSHGLERGQCLHFFNLQSLPLSQTTCWVPWAGYAVVVFRFSGIQCPVCLRWSLCLLCETHAAWLCLLLTLTLSHSFLKLGSSHLFSGYSKCFQIQLVFGLVVASVFTCWANELLNSMKKEPDAHSPWVSLSFCHLLSPDGIQRRRCICSLRSGNPTTWLLCVWACVHVHVWECSCAYLMEGIGRSGDSLRCQYSVPTWFENLCLLVVCYRE